MTGAFFGWWWFDEIVACLHLLRGVNRVNIVASLSVQNTEQHSGCKASSPHIRLSLVDDIPSIFSQEGKCLSLNPLSPTANCSPLFGCEIQNIASLTPKLELGREGIEPRRFTASLEVCRRNHDIVAKASLERRVCLILMKFLIVPVPCLREDGGYQPQSSGRTYIS